MVLIRVSSKYIPGLTLALCLAIAAVVWPPAASAQPAPKHEFRGVWIATVHNLDWPSSRSTFGRDQQRAQLVTMLDKVQAAGVNAVFFQVRSEADALYDSPYEPWSYWLTGAQGVAPDPFYDPLTFAVEEAHKRGMELHAWFNPYRAVGSSGYTRHSSHVSVQRPEWMLSIENPADMTVLDVLNPGLQEVRDYVATVIADVVRRYDIDGVHFDDYFYPYPPNQIASQDIATFNADPRGFRSIYDWRRDNVNLLMAQVADSVNAIRSSVKFGISPFGIWKNGVPSGIVGLDAYNVIYADPIAWLEAGTIDYLVPQLYWAFGGGQDYGKLAPWWAERAGEAGRHLYTGHGLYRAERATFSGDLFSPDEIPRQIRFNRARDDIMGSVFFRAKNISVFSSRGFADTLRTDLYYSPALTPPMDWKDLSAPDAPGTITASWTGADQVALTWTALPEHAAPEARRYAVYRVRSPAPPPTAFAIDDPNNLIAVTGETSFTDAPGMLEGADLLYYFVTSVSANSIESEASSVVSLGSPPLSSETEQPEAFMLFQSYPNPFRNEVDIRFSLRQPAEVTIRVFDSLGRVVTTLVNGASQQPGTYRVQWDGRTASGAQPASGVYFYSLETPDFRQVKQMVLIK